MSFPISIVVRQCPGRVGGVIATLLDEVVYRDDDEWRIGAPGFVELSWNIDPDIGVNDCNGSIAGFFSVFFERCYLRYVPWMQGSGEWEWEWDHGPLPFEGGGRWPSDSSGRRVPLLSKEVHVMFGAWLRGNRESRVRCLVDRNESSDEVNKDSSPRVRMPVLLPISDTDTYIHHTYRTTYRQTSFELTISPPNRGPPLRNANSSRGRDSLLCLGTLALDREARGENITYRQQGNIECQQGTLADCRAMIRRMEDWRRSPFPPHQPTERRSRKQLISCMNYQKNQTSRVLLLAFYSNPVNPIASSAKLE
jgi:hypothetical protein